MHWQRLKTTPGTPAALLRRIDGHALKAAPPAAGSGDGDGLHFMASKSSWCKIGTLLETFLSGDPEIWGKKGYNLTLGFEIQGLMYRIYRPAWESGCPSG